MVFKFLAVSIAALLWLVYVAVRLHELKVEPVRSVLDMLSRLSWVNRVAVLIVIAHLTMFAGAKHGTNDVDDVSSTNNVELVDGGDTNEVGGIVLNAPQPTSNGASFFGGCGGPGVSALPPVGIALRAIRNEIAFYELVNVTTNANYSYALPADGTIRGTWHLTGAYEDVQRVSLDPHPSSPIPHPFAFPLGSDLCTSLWTYTWGKVRSQLKNASNEIAAVGAPMSELRVKNEE